MIYCLLCGKECADTAEVCDNCGNPLMRAPSGEDASAKNYTGDPAKSADYSLKSVEADGKEDSKDVVAMFNAAGAYEKAGDSANAGLWMKKAEEAGLDTAKIDPAKYIVYIKDLGQSKAYYR